MDVGSNSEFSESGLSHDTTAGRRHAAKSPRLLHGDKNRS